MLADIKPGDEVILPSYTFVSTANAFVLRGGVPVFVDIRPDTLNIDESGSKPRSRPQPRRSFRSTTRAWLRNGRDHGNRQRPRPAGDRRRGARVHGYVQGPSAGEHRPPGHGELPRTKNLISGEGGALLVNDPRFPATRRSRTGERYQPESSSSVARSTSTPGLTLALRISPARSRPPFYGRRSKRPNPLPAAVGYLGHLSSMARATGGEGPASAPDSFQRVHAQRAHVLRSSSGSPRSARASSRTRETQYRVRLPLRSPSGFTLREAGRAHRWRHVCDGFVADRLVRLPMWLGLEDHMSALIGHIGDVLRE